MTTGAIKMVGLPLAVASGFPFGMEGPFVHIGACIARQIVRCTAWVMKRMCPMLYMKKYVDCYCGLLLLLLLLLL